MEKKKYGKNIGAWEMFFNYVAMRQKLLKSLQFHTVNRFPMLTDRSLTYDGFPLNYRF